jgi:hypothetical protein
MLLLPRPRWQVTMLLWSSLFLEVEEIFVEFIDCPLFYSVTLIWLQRWHGVKWEMKMSMNDEWPRIVKEAIAPCLKVLRTFVFRNWWIDKDIWVVNRHSRLRSDPTNFRMLSIGVSFLDFSCFSAWSYAKFDRCICRKSVEKIQISFKSDKNKEYFTWRPIYIFYHISLSYS